MADASDIQLERLDEVQNLTDVNPRRFYKLRAQSVKESGTFCSSDSASDRESFGPGNSRWNAARGGETDQPVAGPDRAAVYDMIIVDDAHGKAGYIVFVLGIKARHLCCLSADERAAGLSAALRDAPERFAPSLGMFFPIAR